MTFHGYVISKDILKMDNIGKVVLKWPNSRNLKSVQCFIGLLKKKKKLILL